jgi:N-formylmaleamate deformylase
MTRLTRRTALLALALTLPALAAEAPATTAFSVQVSGKGKPMILIPGLSSAGEVWDETVAYYRRSHQCHVLTLAGFAGQPRIASPMLATVRKELAGYLRRNRLQGATLVGHSLGGFLALWLAAEEPDLVGRLVIVDSLPFAGGVMAGKQSVEQVLPMATSMRKTMLEQTQEQYEAFVRSGMVLKAMITDEARQKQAMAWGLGSDRTAVADAMYEMYTTDLRPSLARIKVPALVLGSWVAYQQYATREQVEGNFKAQYATLKGVQLVLSDTARHFIMWDDPQWMFARVDEFLGSTAR